MSPSRRLCNKVFPAAPCSAVKAVQSQKWREIFSVTRGSRRTRQMWGESGLFTAVGTGLSGTGPLGPYDLYCSALIHSLCGLHLQYRGHCCSSASFIKFLIFCGTGSTFKILHEHIWLHGPKAQKLIFRGLILRSRLRFPPRCSWWGSFQT